jgi:glutamate racemase
MHDHVDLQAASPQGQIYAEAFLLIDWGVGGLGVLRELIDLNYCGQIVYVSDSGNTPFGKMSSHELIAALSRILSYFYNLGGRQAFLACNAASTVLNDLVLQWQGKGLVIGGIIEFGRTMIEQDPGPRIGVIGGNRTIESKTYAYKTPEKETICIAAQPLSGMIERGEQDSAEFFETARKILEPLAACDALLMACTHYSAAESVFRKILPNCRLLDPAKPAGIALSLSAAEVGMAPGRDGNKKSFLPQFFTTGNCVESGKAAALAFGFADCKFQSLRL